MLFGTLGPADFVGLSVALLRGVKGKSSSYAPTWYTINKSPVEIKSLTVENWKKKLEKLDQASFNKYRMHKCINFKRVDEVSRGFKKMEEMDREAGIKIRGNILDHGSGRGGFTQYLIQKSDVLKVKAISLWKLHHEQFNLEEKHYGFEKVKVEKGDFLNSIWNHEDWVLNDVGEEGSGEEMANQDIRKLNHYKNWNCNKLLKIMNPTNNKVLTIIKEDYPSYHFYRSRYSRNSTAELYLLPGRGDVEREAFSLVTTLNDRMDEKWVEPIIENGKRLPQGMGIKKKPWKISHPERLRSLKLEKCSAQFSHWDVLGGLGFEPIRNPGDIINRVRDYVLAGLRDSVPGIGTFGLTDVSPTGLLRTFKEKIDKTPQMPEEGKILYEKSWNEIQKTLPKVLRRLTIEEVKNNIRNDAAVGHKEWATAKIAKEDPLFWKMVQAEIRNHEKGKWLLGIFETMPKREKKERAIGKRKSSRMIAYYPLVERAVEMFTLGIINHDHWAYGEGMPEGVTGRAQHQYGEMMKERMPVGHESGQLKEGVMFQGDILGWDTCMSEYELEKEKEALISRAEDKKHAISIETLYNCYKNPIIKMKDPEGKIMVLSGRGQRMSGSSPTYAMNTFSNAVLQNAVYTKLHGKDDTKMRERRAISGDDCVIWWPTEIELEEVRKTFRLFGKELKGRFGEGSDYSYNLRDTWFCSHTYTPTFIKGITRWMLDRSSGEILGKARLVLGGFGGGEIELAMTKGYANYLITTFPHRRDVRLAATAVRSICPENVIPMGKVKDTYWGTQPWMTNEKIVTIFNNMWENYPKIDSLHDIHYASRGREKELGSDLDSPSRAEWSRRIPTIVRFGRENFGNGTGPDDYMGYTRYRNKNNPFDY